jgi:putative addiction module component (TIGR02574 family)
MGKAAIDLASLTAEQKLERIDELWTSLEADAFELSEEQRAELDRRIERLDVQGPIGTPWESVRDEMRAK